jgi:hypothetical protein
LADIRIYRATFVLALLAVVVVMFSLEERPPPLVSTLAPDAFDSRGAYVVARELGESIPDRRPGSPGDRRLAGLVEGRFQNLRFETSRDEFSAEADGEDTQLVNVLGSLSGPSERQILVAAQRDSLERPGAPSAVDTAMLLELARALAAIRHEKTLVFASLDGGQAGAAGARRLAESYPERDKLDAVLVLDDVAAAFARRPYLVPWSSQSGRGSLQVLRTLDSALQRELGAGSGSESPLGQYLRQAWPLTLRPQGRLVAAGLDAVTLTARGEVPREPGAAGFQDISRVRLARFGKAALSAVLALDGGRVERSPSGYLVLGRQVLPEWAVALLVIGLLAPALVAAMDALARARRRGRPVWRWMRWALAASVPFLLTVTVAAVFAFFDWLPSTASEALSPPTRRSFGEAAPAVAALALVFALAWVVVRPRLAGGRARVALDDEPEAAVALTLLLSSLVLLLWAGNPFAALVLVPLVHFCLLLSLPAGPNRRLVILVTLAGAALLPAAVLLYYGPGLDLGLDVTQYVLLLVLGDGSAWSAVLGSLIAGSLVSTVLLALSRPKHERHAEITVRGPHTYAGPGSLGGTESALRR